ncbi:hypothetical protein Dimus_037117, partial [Dionaea muscipula]
MDAGIAGEDNLLDRRRPSFSRSSPSAIFATVKRFTRRRSRTLAEAFLSASGYTVSHASRPSATSPQLLSPDGGATLAGELKGPSAEEVSVREQDRTEKEPKSNPRSKKMIGQKKSETENGIET